MIISKKIKIICFSILGVAIIATAIAVPLSLKKSDDEKSLSIEEKFQKLSKSEIILRENSDLDLSIKSNQDKIIKLIQIKAIFLNDAQKKSLELVTKTNQISFRNHFSIKVKITFDKKVKEFTFDKIKRQTTVQDRFLLLSEKLLTIENISDIDLSDKINQDKVIAKIKERASFLNNAQKKLLKLVTKTGLINTSTPIQIEIKATFFNKEKSFTFNFQRKASKQEIANNKSNFDKLKAKIDKFIKTLNNNEITFWKTSNIDLSQKSERLLIKSKLIDKINKTNDSNISLEEKEAIIITTELGITSYTNFLNINIKIIFGKNTKTYVFKLKIIFAKIVANIKAKIKDKDILIKYNIPTSNQSEIQTAIREQLKIENSNLSVIDLAKITSVVSSISIVKKTIKIKIKSIHYEEEIDISIAKQNLLKNSNIIRASSGTIFEDSKGNLWSMSREGLQVLVKQNDGSYASEWNDSTTEEGLTKDSNITRGIGGTIFEDSKGNLWSMGNEKLQVLVKQNNGSYASEWTDSTTEEGLTKGSNITNGANGTIFEDSKGNLWSMGNKKLQVLVKKNDGSYANEWTDSTTASGLTKGSNITNDGIIVGTIFEDSKGNLWSMGNKKLQVLVKQNDGSYASEWTDSTTAPGLTKGSNITDGYTGTILKDSQDNLWSMGNKKLQVLVKQNDGSYASEWNDSTTKDGLTKGSNITSGIGGTIFEDSKGNLWSMGNGTKLQVLKKNASKWTDSTTAPGLTKGSNITNGIDGTIFEDSKGNLWSMVYGRKLQVLVKQNDGSYASEWTDSTTAPGLTKGSNITSGLTGKIFEDSQGNLWSMGFNKKLQVLIKQKDGSYANEWKD